MTPTRLAELEVAFASAPQPWREWGHELVMALRDAHRGASLDDVDLVDIERATAELDLRLEVS